MPKKKESIGEKLKEVVSDIVEEVEEVGEKVIETTKEIVSDLTERKPNKPAKKSEDSKEDKLAKLKAKAKALEKSVSVSNEDLAKKVKGEEETKDTLVSIEDYLKSSIHLGTRAITPDMRPYVYKRRADSLAVFNTSLLDEKIRESGEFLSQYAPEDVIVVCKRDAGSKAVEMFSQVTGIRSFIKKYPAGILTNPQLDNFLETDLVVICDPWTDKSALADARRIKLPVLAICDTNNYTHGITKVLPGNNKSAKSLGMIFYLLARIYVEKRKIVATIPPVSEWIENWDSLVPPK